MYKSLYIPLLGWSASISTHYPEFSEGQRWAHYRGRCREHVFRMPLWRWNLEFFGRGKSYRELVGAPKYLKNLDWVIDEFDSSFNDLAVASLRYHMDYSVCYCDPERHAKYQDLVDRLTEPRPGFTDEEMAVLNPPGWKWGDDFEPVDGGHRLRTKPEKSAVFAAHRAREEAYDERIRQARRDFVDIIPELWS